jgi:hypothetical protein
MDVHITQLLDGIQVKILKASKQEFIDFIDQIKKMIPARDRDYNPETQTWTIRNIARAEKIASSSTRSRTTRNSRGSYDSWTGSLSWGCTHPVRPPHPFYW